MPIRKPLLLDENQINLMIWILDMDWDIFNFSNYKPLPTDDSSIDGPVAFAIGDQMVFWTER